MSQTASARSRAPRNRTIVLSEAESARLKPRLLRLECPAPPQKLLGRTICQDLFDVLPLLPAGFVDLLIVDPPYNLSKSFNGRAFQNLPEERYAEWMESWLSPLRRVLKPDASVYICSDWTTSSIVQRVGTRFLTLRNRITWEREKGRGAKRNWKNCSEDIWYFTVSDDYTFNVDAVKLKRRVIAPYRDGNGVPKDWEQDGEGPYRLTHPSNLWTDLTVPFWSMPENTDHPTQKPEKLIAKLILASSNSGDVILDPFVGSGTTSVVARKLDRQFVGIEQDELYCCLCEKRLELANIDSSIQGYHDGVFWERNTLAERRSRSGKRTAAEAGEQVLFE